MAESVVLSAQKRDVYGSHKVKRLRREGLIPSVLYGHKEATVPLSISNDEFTKALRHGVRVVDLQQPGGKLEKALIREVQFDHLGQEILHVDFARISEH